jgi:hypothetical protein
LLRAYHATSDDYKAWMDYPEFYSLNFGNLNIHPGRMQVLCEIFAHSNAKAFEIYCALWYAYGTADSHCPITGYRLSFRRQHGRDRGHHNYPPQVEVLAKPELSMGMETALMLTNPNGAVYTPLCPATFGYHHPEIVNPESLGFADTVERQNRTYKGAAARAMQQLNKDIEVFGEPKFPPVYFAEPTDIALAKKEALKHVGMHSEYFESNFANIALHPFCINELEEIRECNPVMGLFGPLARFWNRGLTSFFHGHVHDHVPPSQELAAQNLSHRHPHEAQDESTLGPPVHHASRVCAISYLYCPHD